MTTTIFITLIITLLGPIASWLVHILQASKHHQKDAIDFLKEFDNFTRAIPSYSIGSRYIQEYFSAISGSKVSIYTIRMISTQKDFLITLKECQKNSKIFRTLDKKKPSEERVKLVKRKIKLLYLLVTLSLSIATYLQMNIPELKSMNFDNIKYIEMAAYVISMLSFLIIGFTFSQKLKSYKFEIKYYHWDLLFIEQAKISEKIAKLANNFSVEEHAKEVFHQMRNGYIFDVREALNVLSERTSKINKKDAETLISNQI